jgi:membrane associated rhomboid family serine protease
VLRLIRFAILFVLALLILSLVMAIGSVTTGPLEKVVLDAAIGGTYGLAVLAWRIGMESRASRSG